MLLNSFSQLALHNVDCRSLGLSIAVSLILILSLSKTSQADLIDVEIKQSNIIAGAEFVQGELNKPAILLLHGFLQTRNFFTVSRLTTSLADEGYTVLSPTLSLGVNKRNNSLPCEAIHTHNMNDDVQEIKFWVDWLKKKGYQDIVLVGHSYGSLQLLVYLSEQNKNFIKKIIATSLVDVEHDIGIEKNKSQISQAKMLIKENNNAIAGYKISFCNKYITSPAAFMSYANWNKEDIIALLKTIRIPLHIIMGGNDTRMNKNWPKMLKQAKANVTVIKGANHFFDAEYEFDLIETVLNLIKQN